jgi:phosphate transport system protein
MRETFHAELDELTADAARMARLAGQMMTNAAIALHQTDLALAGVVIADCDQMNSMLNETEQHCIIVLTSHAPVAGNLRLVVVALRAVNHLKRMANLARHIADIARCKHPNPMMSSPVRPVLARMSLLASQLAEDAATAIEYRDPLSGNQLAEADDEVDALRVHLFSILFAKDWSRGVEPAVDAALIGRYYERFADHAVAIAREICYLGTDQISKPPAAGLTASDHPPIQRSLSHPRRLRGHTLTPPRTAPVSTRLEPANRSIPGQQEDHLKPIH